jgi:hypothetical protein
MIRECVTPNHVYVLSKVSPQSRFDLDAPKLATSDRIKKQACISYIHLGYRLTYLTAAEAIE